MNEILNKIENRCIFRLNTYGVPAKRINKELDWFNENGGAEALLLISNLIHFLESKQQPVGPGYGYTTCSLVCYGLGITDVRPTEWLLPFERFTRSFRPDYPFVIETSQTGLDYVLRFLAMNADFPEGIDRPDQNTFTVTFLNDDKYTTLRLVVYVNENLRLHSSHRRSDLDRMVTRLSGHRCVRLFDNENMDNWLKSFQPSSFLELCLLEALNFPGRSEMLTDLVSRKFGSSSYTTGFDVIDMALKESYGLLVYQEQQMMIRKIWEGLDSGEDMPAEIHSLLDVPFKDLACKGHTISRTMQLLAKRPLNEVLSDAAKEERIIKDKIMESILNKKSNFENG